MNPESTMQKMEVENVQLNAAVDAIKSMVQCKELKNAAPLRKLTDLKADIDNKTRWSGKNIMLIKWLRICEDLIKVSNGQDSTIEINSSSVFKNCAIKLSGRMEEADIMKCICKLKFVSKLLACYVHVC